MSNVKLICISHQNLKSAASSVHLKVSMYIEDIQVACRKVLNGDQNALKVLGLDKLSYSRAAPHSLANTSLQVTYNSVLTTAVAARELQLEFFQKQCDLNMQLLEAIAAAKKIQLTDVIDPEDVAEVMLALIHNKATRHNYKEVPEETESNEKPSGEEEEDQDLDKSSASEEDSHEQQVTTLPTARAEEQGSETPPAPTSTAEGLPSTSKPADEECTATTRTTTSTAEALPSTSKSADEECTATTRATTSTAEGLPSTSKPKDRQHTARPRATTSTAEGLPSTSKPKDRQHTATPRATTSTAEGLPSPTKPADGHCTVTPAAPAAYSNKNSKNKRRQCSLCNFFGTHLERHVAAKHPDAAQTRPERVAIVHRHDRLSRKQQGKKEVCLYQCTIKKCGAIVTRLGQHLRRTHKITDKEHLKRIKSSCRRLPPGGVRQPKQQNVKVSVKTAPKKQRCETPNESSSSEDESFKSDGCTSEENPQVDHHQLIVDADIDDMSSFADTDEEDQCIMSATEQQKWSDVYLAKSPNRTVHD